MSGYGYGTSEANNQRTVAVDLAVSSPLNDLCRYSTIRG